MKRQRDECLEAAGFILQRAQLQQVIDAVFIVFNVPVQHGCIGLQPKLVREARGVEPLLAVDLVIANNVANALSKDLGAAARQRVHACFLQLDKRVAKAELGNLGQESDLDHRERLDVHAGKALLEAGDQVQKILERQVGMQAADNVELGHRLGIARSRSLPSFLQRHRVGARRVFLSAKGAQPAGRNAHVRRIDVTIYVEVRAVPVKALANVVGQPTDRKDVGGTIQGQSIHCVQPRRGEHLVGDRPERGILSLKRAWRHRTVDDTARNADPKRICSYCRTAAALESNSSIRDPGWASNGSAPRLKIRAPVAPSSVTLPFSTRNMAPSRNPTTGVSFSSRYWIRRSSRVSPMCREFGSASK